MPLILRKCNYNGYSSRNFYYGNAGDIATCPDWNPKPECGNGLHGLKEGNGNWNLLSGDDWLVIETNDEDVVNIDKDKCKFRTGKILFRGSDTELANSEFPAKLNLNSESAYRWALNIGNHDIMMHKITDSKFAYYWARHIGNQDVMVDKITGSDIAYLWALSFGNRDIMIHKITGSQTAYLWAKYIGNSELMKPKVTDPYYINLWNEHFPNDQI